MKREKPLSSAQKTILRSIYTLALEGQEATIEGLSLLLVGKYVPETELYRDSKLFGYLSSISGKKIKGRIHQLIREGYVKLIYDHKLDAQFVTLSEKCLSLSLNSLEKKTLSRKQVVLFRRKGK